MSGRPTRLQFLPARPRDELVLGGDGRALAAIEAAIGSWHAANPPFRGVAWASGIEVALRAISLIVCHDVAGERLEGDATRGQVGEILAASAPSGCHGFRRGILLGQQSSRRRTGGRVSDRAGARHQTSQGARAALIAEIDRQILADGSPAEQTPTYGAFTAELGLLAADAARQAGEPFPADFEASLAAFADFIGWLEPQIPALGTTMTRGAR